MTAPDDLIDEAAGATFEGWDFSWLGHRSDDPKTPWRYAALVAEALAASRSALDIDTGGGEALAAARPSSSRPRATRRTSPSRPRG